MNDANGGKTPRSTRQRVDIEKVPGRRVEDDAQDRIIVIRLEDDSARHGVWKSGGVDGARTRDLRLDRPAF